MCSLCAEPAKLVSQSDTQPNSLQESDLRDTLVSQGSAPLGTTQRNAAQLSYNFPLTDSQPAGPGFESPPRISFDFNKLNGWPSGLSHFALS